MSGPRRVDAGERATLAAEGVRVVALAALPDGRPREALVVIDEGGQVRAYLNRCKHLPIPIDGGSREFLSDDGSLRCGTHGALYRRRDGLCTHGPCKGAALDALPVEEEANRLYVLDARG